MKKLLLICLQLTVYPSGTISNKARKQYVLKAEDIISVIALTNVDFVAVQKEVDSFAYNMAGRLLVYSSAYSVQNFKSVADVTDNALNVYELFNYSASRIGLVVSKGTYASLAEAQAALAGTIITYGTKPELSTIPVTVHSEPINLAGAVKTESDRNTRQDEQINDITLLLDYLIVVNA